jgi:phosphatidylinositol alpha-1,6-mannosyltransferase
VLSVGRLQRRKGFDTMIECVARLNHAGKRIRYALIGIGEQSEELRTLSRRLGVEHIVHFLGHVPAPDLPRWYNAAAVFAMPNREIDGDNEGFGMVFLEAAACGRPSIAGTDGGTGAAVKDTLTGFRVDGKVPEAVFERLQHLLEHPSEATLMGQRAAERARQEFSWEQVAERTRQLG